MSKHSKTHAHEHLRRRLRREGALGRREADMKKHKDGSKYAAAHREVEALRKKLGH